jgi:hypothetical protein
MGKVIEPHHDLETIRKLSLDHLSRGVRLKNHPFRSFVLTTARPNARMVILRNLGHEPLSISVYTDGRSHKIAELKSNPNAACLFWHPSARFQLKLMVKATIHQGDEQALEHWSRMGSRGKESYNTKLSPGTPMDSDGSVTYKDPFNPTDFCLLNLEVEGMDILQLRREGHIRARFGYVKGKKSEASFLVP